MQHYRSELESLQANGSAEPKELSVLRSKAFSRFTELGFPTKKWENWQFTDFSPFKKSHFRLPTLEDLQLALEYNILPLNDYYSIIILNGHFQENLSNVPSGVTIRTLLDVFMDDELTDFLNAEENPFVALNTSLMNSGLAIDIADDMQIDTPIYYQFITSGFEDQIMNHPRLLIRLGKNSSANFIEHYHSKNTTNYWNNCVTISELGNNSVFNHTRIQEDTCYHVSNLDYHLHKDAVLNSTIYNQGAELNRGDIRVSFHGKNATANINGLSLLKYNQHMDTRIIIDHMQPHCNSHQLFKYILDDKATGVFNGRVIVREDSQRTNSSQSNKNLLLSKNARMQSNPQLEPGGMLICNTASFTKKNLTYAGFDSNPLEDGSLEDYFRIYAIDMSKIVAEVCADMSLTPKTVNRTKNLFALGLLYWIYDRPMETTKNWLEMKFAKRPELIEANVRAMEAGYNYGETTEIFTTRYKVDKADLPAGTYRNIVGNYALTLGLVAAAEKSKLPLFYGSYPITPASDILHHLAALKHHNVKTFQAEDEIAGMTSIIGAAFTGNLAVTASSGPGIALKGEALGLAIIAELPMVIVNVQRGGPSTGLPTKTEQADLLQALYGRNGEAPLPVIAAATPGDCFYAAYEACRIALKYMTPVMLLTDGYLANGSEPWAIPNLDDLEPIDVSFADTSSIVDGQFMPYLRNKETLARPWAIPGTAGLEHRIGGLEKEDVTGNVNYDPENHHHMTLTRQQKVNNVVNDIPPTEIYGKSSGELLILSWGGTMGACRSAAEDLQDDGKSVSHVHLRWLNPLPKDLGEILIRFKNVLIPEINMGQLIKLIRAEYLVDAHGLNIVRGKPIGKGVIIEKINERLGS